MATKFSLKTLLVSIITGIVVVIFFSWASGSKFETALFPVLAMLSGFIVTGFLIGIISKGVTIIEPGLGSIIVAGVTFFVIPQMQIQGFMEITYDSDWIIILMNGVILTFIGAWLGEKFQNSENLDEDQEIVEWSWIVAGTIFGVSLSIIIAIVINLIIGNDPIYFIIPFFIALVVSGYMVGYRSPGVTIKEAGISGFLIITFIFTIVRLTLVSNIEIVYVIGGIILGYIVSTGGGWLGEKMQARKIKGA
jgi:hypothetical protein